MSIFQHRRANKPDAVNPAVAPQFHTQRHWRGVTDPERSAADPLCVARKS
jgi:hypothetical protein